MTTIKTVYPAAGKVVLEQDTTGIMISTEYYAELSGEGMDDEQMFKELKE